MHSLDWTSAELSDFMRVDVTIASLWKVDHVHFLEKIPPIILLDQKIKRI